MLVADVIALVIWLAFCGKIGGGIGFVVGVAVVILLSSR